MKEEVERGVLCAAPLAPPGLQRTIVLAAPSVAFTQSISAPTTQRTGAVAWRLVRTGALARLALAGLNETAVSAGTVAAPANGHP
ncbi:hypothetical protein [Paraburkholderia azotifigens]|uniref:Uncharacterized protein n=1 Tax=Paraburkholderia azotifigens TaxID=2057004 RepID=A0ABU9QUS4_9BURK|nr:hypothetical protein [Paraburkholderia azotifigens]